MFPCLQTPTSQASPWDLAPMDCPAPSGRRTACPWWRPLTGQVKIFSKDAIQNKTFWAENSLNDGQFSSPNPCSWQIHLAVLSAGDGADPRPRAHLLRTDLWLQHAEEEELNRGQGQTGGREQSETLLMYSRNVNFEIEFIFRNSSLYWQLYIKAVKISKRTQLLGIWKQYFLS